MREVREGGRAAGREEEIENGWTDGGMEQTAEMKEGRKELLKRIARHRTPLILVHAPNSANERLPSTREPCDDDAWAAGGPLFSKLNSSQTAATGCESATAARDNGARGRNGVKLGEVCCSLRDCDWRQSALRERAVPSAVPFPPCLGPSTCRTSLHLPMKINKHSSPDKREGFG